MREEVHSQEEVNGGGVAGAGGGVRGGARGGGVV